MVSGVGKGQVVNVKADEFVVSLGGRKGQASLGILGRAARLSTIGIGVACAVAESECGKIEQ